MSGLNSRDLERRVDLEPRRLDPLLGVDRPGLVNTRATERLRRLAEREIMFVVQYHVLIL